MKTGRTYAWLQIRAADDDKRTIEGIATTPDQARDGDIIETTGIQFRLPIPFLLNHRSDSPLGNVTEAKVGKDGISVRIQIAPAGVSESIDEAWRKIRAGIIRGLSIGWRTIAEMYDKEIGGFRILKSEWLELSAVPVPADPNATITSVRSADEAILAALGRRENPVAVRSANLPGASGQTTRNPMDYAQRKKDLNATLTANVARMKAIDEKIAAEGRVKDDAERQEFDELNNSVRSLTEEIRDVDQMQKNENLLIASATPVTPQNTATPQEASKTRGGERSIVRVRPVDLPKGTGFTRFAIALFHAGGDRERAAQIVESNRVWMDQTPEVVTALRAPVLAGTTTLAGWAAELSPLQNLASEFVEMLRPMTLIGKIPGFRMIPFNSLMPRQTAGTSGSWVGQGARKPVGRLTTDTVELKPLKIAKIVAITQELERFSNPAAEAVVRRDLAEGIQETMDTTFADPTVSASANVSPASIFNGADTSASAGGEFLDVLADLKTAIGHFTGLGMSSGGLVIVTTEDVATGLSLMPTSLGVAAFPDMTTTGGNLRGIPVFTSSVVPSGVMGFFKPSEVFLADDGQASIDVSREASLFMDDGGSPESTTITSLWQENKLGIKAERFVNWVLRRTDASYYLSAVDYDGAA